MSDAGGSEKRLLEERKLLRKTPLLGFHGKPSTREDGSTDLFVWKCGIPGPQGTAWAGATYPLTIKFTPGYPVEPPTCSFPAGFFHPNVYASGKVCLSLLDADADLGGQWRPSITISQLLQGIQELLKEPNVRSPAQFAACDLLKKNPTGYRRQVEEQAKKYAE